MYRVCANAEGACGAGCPVQSARRDNAVCATFAGALSVLWLVALMHACLRTYECTTAQIFTRLKKNPSYDMRNLLVGAWCCGPEHC